MGIAICGHFNGVRSSELERMSRVKESPRNFHDTHAAMAMNTRAMRSVTRRMRPATTGRIRSTRNVMRMCPLSRAQNASPRNETATIA